MDKKETKITFFIDGEPIELTLEQAKGFYNELRSFFRQDQELKTLRQLGREQQQGYSQGLFLMTGQHQQHRY